MKEEEGERKTRADLPFPSPTNTAANNKILKRTYWEDMPIRHCGGGRGRWGPHQELPSTTVGAKEGD